MFSDVLTSSQLPASMGLKAAAFVVAAGVGAYLVYTMMADKSPTVTPAHLQSYAKPMTGDAEEPVAEPSTSYADLMKEPEPHEPPPTESLKKAHDIGAVFATALSSVSPFGVMHDAIDFGHLFTPKKGIQSAAQGVQRREAQSVAMSVGRSAARGIVHNAAKPVSGSDFAGGDLVQIAGMALHPMTAHHAAQSVVQSAGKAVGRAAVAVHPKPLHHSDPREHWLEAHGMA